MRRSSATSCCTTGTSPDVTRSRCTARSGPYAWIVPQRQRDPAAPVEMLRRLAFLGVRVMQLGATATHDGVAYPAGTWVVPLDQEFAPLVRELLEPQKYPDMGDDLPYDAAGWTLPFQMNVNAIEAKTPLSPEFRAAMMRRAGRRRSRGARMTSIRSPPTRWPLASCRLRRRSRDAAARSRSTRRRTTRSG